MKKFQFSLGRMRDYRERLLEEEKGTIECKKRADFVILDRNPLKVSKEELADIKVVMTIKDNEVIYRRKEAVYE